MDIRADVKFRNIPDRWGFTACDVQRTTVMEGGVQKSLWDAILKPTTDQNNSAHI